MLYHCSIVLKLYWKGEKGRGGGTILSRSFIDNCLHLTMHSTDSSFFCIVTTEDDFIHNETGIEQTERVKGHSKLQLWKKPGVGATHTYMRAGRRIFVFSTSDECKRRFFQSFFSFFPQFAMITWPWSYRLALRFLDVSNKSYSEAMKFKCRTIPRRPTVTHLPQCTWWPGVGSTQKTCTSCWCSTGNTPLPPSLSETGFSK